MYNPRMDPRTIAAYDEFARKYDEETSDFWDRFPRTFFDKFAASTTGKVLDVGSGPGRDGAVLRDRGLEVVCLDASAAMVEMSRAKGLQSVQGDFLHLPFADESFDAVWAYTSLLHVPKAEVGAALAEVRRVLKPSGTLGLGLIEGEVEEYRDSPKVPSPRWFSFYSRAEVEALLAAHGFSVTYFEVFKPSTKNYLNFIAKKV